jgi:hypothetical protein
VIRALLFCLCALAVFREPAGAAPEAPNPDEVIKPATVDLDPLTCRRKKSEKPKPLESEDVPPTPTPTPAPGTPVPPTNGAPITPDPLVTGSTAAVPPIPNITGTSLTTIVDFDLSGELKDPIETVRTLLAPTMQRHRVMSDEVRNEAEAAAAAIGYHLVGLGTKDTPAGKRVQLHLTPLPMVRKIKVDLNQSILDVLTTPLFEDEVRRRMRVRPGGHLPWDPAERECELDQEKRRIERFLRDEGYFDAEATVVPTITDARVTLAIRVELGGEYKIAYDKIRIPGANRLTGIDVEEIKGAFRRKRCVIFTIGCRDERFTKRRTRPASRR